MTASGITVLPMARDGLVWCSNAANPRAVKATAGDQTIEAFGLIMAAGPISLSRAEFMDTTIATIVIAIVIATVTAIDTAVTTGLAADKSSLAIPTTCISIIVRRTPAAACNWSSRTATPLAGREKAGATIGGASGLIMAAGLISRSAAKTVP